VADTTIMLGLGAGLAGGGGGKPISLSSMGEGGSATSCGCNGIPPKCPLGGGGGGPFSANGGCPAKTDEPPETTEDEATGEPALWSGLPPNCGMTW